MQLRVLLIITFFALAQLVLSTPTLEQKAATVPSIPAARNVTRNLGARSAILIDGDAMALDDSDDTYDVADDPGVNLTSTSNVSYPSTTFALNIPTHTLDVTSINMHTLILPPESSSESHPNVAAITILSLGLALLLLLIVFILRKILVNRYRKSVMRGRLSNRGGVGSEMEKGTPCQSCPPSQSVPVHTAPLPSPSRHEYEPPILEFQYRSNPTSSIHSSTTSLTEACTPYLSNSPTPASNFSLAAAARVGHSGSKPVLTSVSPTAFQGPGLAPPNNSNSNYNTMTSPTPSMQTSVVSMRSNYSVNPSELFWHL